MPDVHAAPDETAALRAVNARLREAIESQGAEIAALRALLEGVPGPG